MRYKVEEIRKQVEKAIVESSVEGHTDLNDLTNKLLDLFMEVLDKNNEALDPVSKPFYEGATVEITGWINGHHFELGEKVTLIEKDGDVWLSRNKDNVEWWVNEDEANVC